MLSESRYKFHRQSDKSDVLVGNQIFKIKSAKERNVDVLWLSSAIETYMT